MKNKIKIFSFLGGILISLFGSFFVSQFVFSADADTKIDVQRGLSEATPINIAKNADLNEVIGKIVGGALSLIAIIFFIIVIYGGFLWMTAQGNEDQAHKGRDAIIASVIGIIIIMGSYTLVQFVFSTVENTGSNKEIKTDTCSEYNPNWSCMDISQCAGATNNKDLVARNDCTPEKNCSINECLSNDDGNYVCCLPYKSFCEINYSGYSCIDDEEKCTSGVVSALAEEPSLCDTEKGDVGNFCCESRVVWSFDKYNTYWSD